MALTDRKVEKTNGIQALDAALRVLAELGKAKGPSTLSDLARASEMPPSKVHRYLASFQRAGLVEQTERSGRYDLGRGAALLGLSAIARHDFVNRTSDGLAELSAITGFSSLLSVWGNEGATVIRWERAPSPAVTSIGLGTTLPLLKSATGRVFLAYAQPAALQVQLEAELRLAQRNPNLFPDLSPTQKGIDNLKEATRQSGFASVDGRFIPGLVAIAAPILDWQNEAQAVVTLVGTDPTATEPESQPVRTLIAFCKAQSFQQ
jgi:DNA-binding IclR family transcriptional regulator